ncbi:response regulator [Terriglobus sp. 2YAB30_2]|jgi:two-component system chemotaxis response regulator CheY|uniref:Response regulator n=1 Tax=Terriglobus albidus TaxID=1592106 RepID=A0A5B9ED41_9BACT|nr:response regulator [Terriglobus albidus]NUQ30901.1 response regulator [Acidobacteriaceae bacterium]QEE28311.1 response regulator [Terriglobus albidus]
MTRNVLIVDDSPAMRKVIRKVLMLSNFETQECFEANDGLEALDILRIEAVDVVLTDINMPRMTGEELLEQMSQDDILSQLPVMVISTDRSEERVRRMNALGAKGYVTKPFAPETLGVALNELFVEA